MARQGALLRVRQTLQARKEGLCKTLANEVKYLRDLNAAVATGDSADAAFGADSDEVSSQLAQMDSRELRQIERALVRLEQGNYGICENCEKKNPTHAVERSSVRHVVHHLRTASGEIPWLAGSIGQEQLGPSQRLGCTNERARDQDLRHGSVLELILPVTMAIRTK